MADFRFEAVPNPTKAPVDVIRPTLRRVVVVASEECQPIIQANQSDRRPRPLDNTRENVECDAIPSLQNTYG